MAKPKITYQFSKGGDFSGAMVEADRVGPKEIREIRDAIAQVVAAEEQVNAHASRPATS